MGGEAGISLFVDKSKIFVNFPRCHKLFFKQKPHLKPQLFFNLEASTSQQFMCLKTASAHPHKNKEMLLESSEKELNLKFHGWLKPQNNQSRICEAYYIHLEKKQQKKQENLRSNIFGDCRSTIL